MHHALECSSFCMRATRAALDLIPMAKTLDDVNLAITSGPTQGYTPLHFACNGSDVGYHKAGLVIKLLDAQANLEARDPKGNTPLLKAAATGITDVVEVLLARGADRHAETNRGKGALELARGSTGTTKWVLRRAGCHETHGQSGRTRTGITAARLARYHMSIHDPGSPWFSPGHGKDNGKGHGKGKGKEKGKRER